MNLTTLSIRVSFIFLFCSLPIQASTENPTSPTKATTLTSPKALEGLYYAPIMTLNFIDNYLEIQHIDGTLSHLNLATKEFICRRAYNKDCVPKWKKKDVPLNVTSYDEKKTQKATASNAFYGGTAFTQTPCITISLLEKTPPKAPPSETKAP